MKKLEYPFLFSFGSILYCLIEILWRGHTHWSMGIAGGLCLLAIYSIRKHCPDVPLWLRCAVGAVVICTVEFAFGFAVNIVLEWNVWDYSDRWLNIYGQICPLYALLWFGLCIPGNYLSSKLGLMFKQANYDNKSEMRLSSDK